MLTISKIEGHYNSRILQLSGLSADKKPTDKFDSLPIINGSEFFEIDTGKIYKFDEENHEWVLQTVTTGETDT